MGALEIILIIVGILLIALGIIGCIAPALPGPVFSYLGILAIHFTEDGGVFTLRFLMIWLVITIIMALVDFFMPIYATKRFGGTKYGIWGGTIGLLLGVFFLPPFGIILGPLIGAILGDIIGGKQFAHALKSGFGSFVGFIIATLLKLAASVTMAVYFVIEMIKIIGEDLNLFG